MNIFLTLFLKNSEAKSMGFQKEEQSKLEQYFNHLENNIVGNSSNF